MAAIISPKGQISLQRVCKIENLVPNAICMDCGDMVQSILTTIFDPSNNIVLSEIRNVKKVPFKVDCDQKMSTTTNITPKQVHTEYLYNYLKRFYLASKKYLTEEIMQKKLSVFLQEYFEVTEKITVKEFLDQLTKIKNETQVVFNLLLNGKKLDQSTLKFKLSKLLVINEQFRQYYATHLKSHLERAFEDIVKSLKSQYTEDQLAKPFLDPLVSGNILTKSLKNIATEVVEFNENDELDLLVNVAANQDMKTEVDRKKILIEIQKIHLKKLIILAKKLDAQARKKIGEEKDVKTTAIFPDDKGIYHFEETYPNLICGDCKNQVKSLVTTSV